MKRVVSLVLGGLALLAIGGFAGWRLHRPGVDARAYAEMRLIAVQVMLVFGLYFRTAFYYINILICVVIEIPPNRAMSITILMNIANIQGYIGESTVPIIVPHLGYRTRCNLILKNIVACLPLSYASG